MGLKFLFKMNAKQIIFFMMLLLLFSCKKSEPKNQKINSNKIKFEKLKITFGLSKYENLEYNLYGERLISSKIAKSDSVLLIYDLNAFDSLEKNKLKLWIYGKKIETDEKFEFLVKKYNLKEMSINNFIMEKSESLRNNYCFSNLDKAKYNFRETKNNLLLSFNKGNLKYKSTVFLNVCNKIAQERIPIYYENEVISTAFFLHDITGDGVEEVFIGYYLVDRNNNNYSVIINNVYSF